MEVTYLTWTEDKLLRQVSYLASGRTSHPGEACGQFRARLAARRFRINRWVTVDASREVLLLKFFH